MNDKIRLLLVEDERTHADIIADTLGEKEFDVTVAYDGVEGLRQFDACRPDVVVTDIMMPGMDGLSLCASIRQTSNVPIIIVSAKDSPLDRVTGITLGSDDYLVKPFLPLELVARVKALFRRSEMMAQPDTASVAMMESRMKPPPRKRKASR